MLSSFLVLTRARGSLAKSMAGRWSNGSSNSTTDEGKYGRVKTRLIRGVASVQD